MLRLKTISVVIHIACWLLFMAFPLLFMNGPSGNLNTLVLLKSPYYWLFCFTYIALFYINAYLLIPKLFLQKKYLAYALSCVLLLIGMYLISPFDRLLHSTFRLQQKNMAQMNREFGPPPGEDPKLYRPDLKSGEQPMQGRSPNFRRRKRFDINSMFVFLMIMAVSTAIKTVQQWQQTEKRIISAEAEKASAELSFLKAQINPHFLFNTLNNIYTLAVTNNANTAESIMKLSNIMRYVTDDVTADFVSLQSEVDCISDYIDLQRLRLSSKTQVNIDVSGDIDRYKIAPLLLMTFVENVFKYGISNQHSGNIDISVSVEDNNIIFNCINPIFERKENIERTGIGIANTKKRLQFLYPGKHTLSITDNNSTFKVYLTLNC